MSLLPLLFELADDNMGYRRSYNPNWDHHFGLGIHPSQMQAIVINPNRLRQSMADLEKDAGRVEGKALNVGKDGFQVSLDVQQFKPSEVSVKLQDNFLIIEGKHEEREDNHGWISRHFTRKYLMPKEIDTNALMSSLSSDGILTVKAPKIKAVESGERVIQIQQTGPAKHSVKEMKHDSANGDKKENQS